MSRSCVGVVSVSMRRAETSAGGGVDQHGFFDAGQGVQQVLDGEVQAVLVGVAAHEVSDLEGQHAGEDVDADAATAAVVLPFPGLLNGLVVVVGALLGGLAGVWALTVLDGCVTPLSVWGSACTPTRTGSWTVVGETSRLVLSFGMFVVVAVAAVAAGGREWLSALTEHRRRLRGRIVPPCAGDEPSGGTRRPVTHTLLLGAMVSAACVLGVQAVAFAADDSGTTDTDSTSTTTLRTRAWLEAGGSELLLGFEDRLQAYGKHLAPLLKQALDNGVPDDAELGEIINGYLEEVPTVKRNCSTLEQQAQTSARFIPIPDERAQSLWQDILSRTEKGGALCMRGAGGSSPLLTEGNDLLLSTADLHEQLDARLGEIQGRPKS